MRQRAGLLTRLERLEGRLNRRAVSRLIFRLYPHEDAGEPTGYMAGNVAFVPGPDETLQDCADRAFAATGSTHLIATYGHAPRWTPPEREEAGSGSPGPGDATEAPHAPENLIDAYWEMAGVGVEATPEQLWEMGAVPGPPERPR